MAFVRIHDIQGARHVSPLVDQEVAAVERVVTQLSARAFYLQDLLPNDDDATSERIRVSSDAVVGVEDVVLVSEIVREVRPRCASYSATSEAFANLTTTEIAATDVTVVGRASALPLARFDSGPGERSPPSELIEVDGAGGVEAGQVPFDP